MAKKHYHWTRLLHNFDDTTTRIVGCLTMQPKLKRSIDSFKHTFDTDLLDIFIGEGYAKTLPGDIFDEQLGKVLAERKAESNAGRKALSNITKLRKETEKLLEALKSAEDELSFRIGSNILEIRRISK